MTLHRDRDAAAPDAGVRGGRTHPRPSRQPHRSDPGVEIRIRRNRNSAEIAEKPPGFFSQRTVVSIPPIPGGTMTFGRLAIIFASTTSVARPRCAGASRSPTGRLSRPRRCSTIRRCCASTRATRPATRCVVAEYVKGVLDKEGIPATIVGIGSQAPQPGRAAEGERQEAAAPDHGPQRHRHHRREEVDASRRSARRATAATSTAAAPSTTRTTSPPR